jgi:hypothetical protein
MSWLYSRVLVEEFLGENCLDGEQSAPLSGNPTQQAYCAPDKMMDFSRLSRFGMTFKPLTESRGEELLMLYLAAFHAKTSQLQETETDLTENEAECGEKWQGLLARYDQNMHLWRTVQCSLLEDLNESLQTLPQWGMTVGGELYLLPTLVQTTDDKEYGLSLIPTPTSSTGGPNHNSPTTLAGKRYTMNLAGYAQKFPTPLASDWKPRGPNSKQQGLSERVRWGTPKAQDSRHALTDRGKGNLGEQVSGLHNGGKLSPLWTEWLMGWPIGWTDLKPLEMDKSHCVPQQLGES